MVRYVLGIQSSCFWNSYEFKVWTPLVTLLIPGLGVYYFVELWRMFVLQMIADNELLEHALVYGSYKGIPKEQVQMMCYNMHSV